MLYCLTLDHINAVFGGVNGWMPSTDGGVEIMVPSVASRLSVPFSCWNETKTRVERRSLVLDVPRQLSTQPLRIRTMQVPRVERIVGQQGMFLEATVDDPEDCALQTFVWTVLDFVAAKVCFVRRDWQYENPAGVTAAAVDPAEDQRLVDVAAGFRHWT
jgi:hypothetical protein